MEGQVCLIDMLGQDTVQGEGPCEQDVLWELALDGRSSHMICSDSERGKAIETEKTLGHGWTVIDNKVSMAAKWESQRG